LSAERNKGDPTRRYRRRGLWAVPIFILFVILVALVASRPVENLVRDLMMSAISPFTAPPGDIVIVTVTEDTLKQFPYRSPIDRGFLASLIDKIAGAGARVIGVDILFDQATEPAKDARLAAAIERAPVPVVLADAGIDDGLRPQQVEFLHAFAPGRKRGLATLARDPIDGVVRELFAGRQSPEGFIPAFAAAIAIAGGMPDDAVPSERGAKVYYRTANSEPHSFPTYPAHTVQVLPDDWFAGKYVLIGVDLPLDDRHLTPFIVLNGVAEGTLPGVVAHAHALSQILKGDKVVPAGLAGSVLLFLVGMLASGWFAWRPFPVLFKPPLIIAVLVAMWTASAGVFARWGVYVPMVGPSVLVAGLSGLVAFLAWKRDREQRRFLERAFSQYVSPAVVRTIVADPERLRLGGERRTVTCVFTDLQGFTSISENMAPEEIAAVLNGYLDRICNLFVDHGATIDKVIGDAVVGFFGAPAEQQDQSERAVDLALAVDGLSEVFRAEMDRAGYRVGVTRIGVHRGPAIVGNFGGERFFDYTAIGDTVNTAARLEGANTYLGTHICVSGAVVENCPKITFRPSGTIFLKGKTQGIEAFEPFGADNAAGALEDYQRAFDLLRARQRGAKTRFAELAKRFPDDPLIAFHHKRLENGEKGTDIVLSGK
jgi:adenylate cyclase